jgi:hypothetical protein
VDVEQKRQSRYQRLSFSNRIGVQTRNSPHLRMIKTPTAACHKWGETVHAVIILKPDCSVSGEDIRVGAMSAYGCGFTGRRNRLASFEQRPIGLGNSEAIAFWRTLVGALYGLSIGAASN